MIKNYEKRIGAKPKQNILTNKVEIIDEYIKNNVNHKNTRTNRDVDNYEHYEHFKQNKNIYEHLNIYEQI